MVRFHTAVLVLTWAAACGSGPAGPKVTSNDPATTKVIAEAQSDAGVPEAPPPPKLVCDAGTTAVPGPVDDASWFCTRSDGMKHGAFVKLHPDGSIAVRGAYADGALHGAWERMHGNGTVAEQGSYVAGRKDGTWKQTSEAGTLLGEYRLVDGTGTVRHWYDSGALYSERAFDKGIAHGTTKRFALDGSVLEISRYKQGKLDGSRTVGTARTLKIEESFQNGVRYGNRKLTYFTMLIAEENYDRAGRLDGDYVLWRSRKVKRVEGEYDHGKRVGNWVWRDRHDKKDREGSYAAGKKTGTWTEWSDGKVVFVGNYAGGKPDGAFTYFDRAGNELGSFQMQGGTGTMQTFHANKKPSTKQKLFKGAEDGLYQVLTTRGKVLVEGHYRGGQKHGSWKELTADGVVTLEQHWSRGKLDGVVKKYVDGKLSLEATYTAGMASGSYVEYRNGKPAVAGQFADDRRTGTWTHHDADGAVVRTATYANGLLDGPYRELAQGFVLEGEMKAGRRHGTWTRTDKAGVVRKLEYTTP